MRTSQLIVAYLQAALFLSLGMTCIGRWVDTRDKRSAHLAVATGLFGLNSLMSAVSQTIWDTNAGEQAPRVWGIITSIIIYLALYAFLLFLADFIRFPAALKGLAVVATIFNILMAILERPEFRFELTATGFERIPIPGVNNLIPYQAYLWYFIVYIALVFGILGVSFLAFGFRVGGLARFRMILIGTGFSLLFILVGLLPLLIFGNVARQTVVNLTNVIRYVALVSAPLLYLGFAPPKSVSRRFTEAGSASVAS